MIASRWRHAALALVITGLAACQPFPSSSVGSNALTVQISHPGLTTQAVAKRPRDVVTYRVTLVTAGTSTAVSGIGTNPVDLEAPTRTTTFTNLPNGTFDVLVDALDGTVPTPLSLVEGGAPVRSSGSVTVTGASVTGALTVTVPLADATGAGQVGSSPVTINANAAAFPNATHFDIAIVNNATMRSKPKGLTAFTPPLAAAPTESMNVGDVQVGDRSGTIPTHEFWFFQVNDTASPNKTATPAKRQGTTPATSGNVSAVTCTVPALVVANAVAGSPPPAFTALAGRVTVDKDDNLYYIPTAANQVLRAPATDYGAPVARVSQAGLQALAVDTDGNIYYSTGSNILRTTAPAYAAGTPVVSASNVGIMAIDGDRNLYWRDTVSQTVKRAEFNGTTYEAPIDTAINVGTSTHLAVDAFGNLYYLINTPDPVTFQMRVMRAPLNANRTTYTAGTMIAECPDTITSLTVDRAGNAYYANVNEEHQIWMTPAGASGVRYVVAGTGTGTGADEHTGQTPLDAELHTVGDLAVGPSGRFFFSSLGDGGVGRFLRHM